MRARLLVAAAAAVTFLSPAYAGTAPTKLPASTSDAQARAKIAHAVFTHLIAEYAAGIATVDAVGTWGERWYRAERDAGVAGPALVTVAKAWVAKLRLLQDTAAMKVKAGTARDTELQEARYFRLSAQLALARAEGH